MTIACAYCTRPAPLAEKGAYVRAPDGWGVLSTCFKVQGSRRQHRIGDSVHFIGSQGMGARIQTDHLCPTCLADPDIAGYYGIPQLEAETAPYQPGRRRLAVDGP